MLRTTFSERHPLRQNCENAPNPHKAPAPAPSKAVFAAWPRSGRGCGAGKSPPTSPPTVPLKSAPTTPAPRIGPVLQSEVTSDQLQASSYQTSAPVVAKTPAPITAPSKEYVAGYLPAVAGGRCREGSEPVRNSANAFEGSGGRSCAAAGPTVPRAPSDNRIAFAIAWPLMLPDL